MPKSTCSIEDCERDAVTRGWCKVHYCRWVRMGDPLGRQGRPTEVKICSVNGCDGLAKCRGWCPKHYVRWKNTKRFDLIPRQPVGCAVSGCEGKH